MRPAMSRRGPWTTCSRTLDEGGHTCLNQPGPVARSGGSVNVQEVKKLDAYLRKLFGNPNIRVVPRGGKTAEVFVGEDDLGELTLDDEDEDLSYNFRMVIQVSNDP